ncbi:unnamed protein product, partial [Ectocarpus sp. 4 AP-2014]
AKRLVWGKHLNGGQTCVAPDYVLIDADLKSEFIKLYKKEITTAYGENPKESEDYPRIVNNKNFNRLKSMLKGLTVVIGGETDEDELYIAPTLVDEPSMESEVMKDEIFGPILPVLGYKTEEDINAVISNFDKPLSFYIFSTTKKFTDRMLSKYSFGGGCINDAIVHYANHNLPFGGTGNSGVGNYHGKFTFET